MTTAIIILLILINICLIVSQLSLHAKVKRLEDYEWIASGAIGKLDRRTQHLINCDPFKDFSDEQNVYVHGRLKKVKIKMYVTREELDASMKK